ncbi:MAG: hypothetical protein CL609_25410 [Anaerolineaceae bacterium]|nr:hypothetical protein [Anaerolineaceae bacterium]
MINGEFKRSFIKFRNRTRRIYYVFKNEEEPSGLIHYPYKNLVFKGGGIRGLAYAGALEVLEKNNILQQIERVAGTSAGAITAMLVSLRLSFTDTLATLHTLDHTKVPQTRINTTKTSEIINSLGLRNGDLVCTNRMLNEFGWYSSLYFYEWLQETIAKFCDGNGKATFSDFKDKGFRDLFIVASNLSKHRAELFSYETTPNVAVADAVRMSMSIPFFFQALRFDGKTFGQGDIYIDGGLYDNFPIQLFDNPKYAKQNPWYIHGINWETLGCYLYPYRSEEELEKDPKTLREYLVLTLDNIFDAFQMMSYENSEIDKKRTIKINDCGISPIEFNIPIHSDRYYELINSGRNAATQFLNEDFPNEIFT